MAHSSAAHSVSRTITGIPGFVIATVLVAGVSLVGFGRLWAAVLGTGRSLPGATVLSIGPLFVVAYVALARGDGRSRRLSLERSVHLLGFLGAAVAFPLTVWLVVTGVLSVAVGTAVASSIATRSSSPSQRRSPSAPHSASLRWARAQTGR